MDSSTLNAYALYGTYLDGRELERMNSYLKHPYAVYSLEMATCGAVAADTDEEWSGFACPSFTEAQLGLVAKMISELEDITATVKNGELVIDDEASGNCEIIRSYDGKYELSGWCLFKFDKQSILDLMSNHHWEVSDVASLILWLEANDAGNYEAYNDQRITPEIDEIRRLGYMALRSIRQSMNLVTTHSIIDQNDDLKALISDYNH